MVTCFYSVEPLCWGSPRRLSVGGTKGLCASDPGTWGQRLHAGVRVGGQAAGLGLTETPAKGWDLSSLGDYWQNKACGS